MPLARLLLWTLLLMTGLVMTLWSLCALLLRPLLPRRWGLHVGRLGIAWSFRTVWVLARATGMLQMNVQALRSLADEPGLMIVANHPSLLDAAMLVAQLPRSACVMKASLMRNPLLWPGAKLARYIGNRSPRKLLRTAIAELRRGGQLVMFPEGTRTTRAPLNALQPGFMLIARHARVPVQTVFIDTTSPYLSKGWPLWRLPPLPIEFSVRLGRRFQPGPHGADDLREIERYMADGVRRGPSRPSA